MRPARECLDLRRRDNEINRIYKYLTAVLQPAFWPALARGVMPTVEHINALRSLNPRTVIDVGASKGQFSLVARYLFPLAQIYAFEPLERERSIYQSLVSAPVQMHPVAVAAKKNSAKFYVASSSDSSSLLALSQKQKMAYGVCLASTIRVEVERLGDVINAQDLVGPVLLKLDVQGAELQVLQGAEEILPCVDEIYCEVSFVELYKHQPNAIAIITFLDRYGFDIRGVFNLSSTKAFGPTQADLLFVKRA